ncbi:MAG: hypothetical protein LBH03_05185 [Holophagales bacterium]|jgi:hypothetical protein|nr:hypothetical protein [Holophagales bacterium]
MKFKILLLSFTMLTYVYGQKKSDTPPTSDKKIAADSGGIMDFLVQSQIVEFKTSLNRDPFSTPTIITSNNESFSIDDITIQGKVVIQKKTFALILDHEQNVREIPIGFKFIDGELTAITENALVFTQWDANSPDRSLQRTVTKPFRREEAK